MTEVFYRKFNRKEMLNSPNLQQNNIDGTYSNKVFNQCNLHIEDIFVVLFLGFAVSIKTLSS
jgi:hypothetical protein